MSKGHGPEAIQEALAAGVSDFGENYAQELETKAEYFTSASALSGLRPRWQYQGRLQTRKIRDILKASSSLLSVSRVVELEEIDKRARVPVECLIEVNLAEEPQKGGVLPPDILRLISAAMNKTLVYVAGLMAVPPQGQDPTPWFRKLREIRDLLELRELSMGMSSDFESAIGHGATMVRIGTAIFGERRAR